jgi:hypothetical protein
MTAPLTNQRRAARCCYCGRICPPGEAYVWRCTMGEACSVPLTRVRGWHAICLDMSACRGRVTKAASGRWRARVAQRAELEAMGRAGEQLEMEV